MSPENRARGVVRCLCEPLENGKPYLETPMRTVMAEVIAQAIREAEEAAYERGKAEYIESVRNCILIDKERYAQLRLRRFVAPA